MRDEELISNLLRFFRFRRPAIGKSPLRAYDQFLCLLVFRIPLKFIGRTAQLPLDYIFRCHSLGGDHGSISIGVGASSAAYGFNKFKGDNKSLPAWSVSVSKNRVSGRHRKGML